MASSTGAPRLGISHRRRLALSLAVGLSGVSLACIPAATARTSRVKSAPDTSTSTQTGASSKPAAPGNAQRTEDAGTVSQQPEAPAARSSRHPRRTADSAPAQGSEPGSTLAGHGGPPPVAQRPDPAHGHQAAGRGAPSTGQPANTTASGEQGEGAGHAQPLVKSDHAGSRHAQAVGKGRGAAKESELSNERRRLQERAGKPAASHVARNKARQVEALRPAVQQGTPTAVFASASASPATTATAATASVATVAAVATPTSQAASTSPPAISGGSLQASTGARRARAQAGGRRGAAAVLSSAPAAPVAASTTTPALTRQSTRAGHTARRAGTPSRSSPLVTTITKIVGVVPTPVRVLIGALLALALALAVRSRLAARRARRLERQRAQLLEDVGLLQAALLPVPPARLGPVGTTAAYSPAAGPAAGGDFYDVFALDDGQLAVIVGDISGHGRQALPHTALVRFTLRAYLEAGLSPRGAVQTAGAVLERQLGGSYATVVAAVYNPRERVLVYACAGHPPPVVLGSASGARPLVPVIASSSPPIGVGMATGVRQTIVSIPGRSQVCFYTDGVTEARVGSELFGAERVAAALAALGPQASASALLDRVAERSDSRPDDMAACLLSIEGGDAGPSALAEELELDREEAASERTEQFLLACGVPSRDVAEAMSSAHAAAARAGSVVLEVRRGDGPTRVCLQRENLAYLHTRHAARQADLRAAR